MRKIYFLLTIISLVFIVTACSNNSTVADNKNLNSEESFIETIETTSLANDNEKSEEEINMIRSENLEKQLGHIQLEHSEKIGAGNRNYKLDIID